MGLKIKQADVFRATLADDCGNTGYIGLSPAGDRYHVVVPVDAMIARGLKACNRPDDGTPFGGYAGWGYFECLPFPAGLENGRQGQAHLNSADLAAWAAQHGFSLEFVI